MLKMASSTDSVEEWRRLQGRVITQRYRDHQSKDARAQRRQSHHDRRRAAHQRATEARWRLQEPPEERSVCTTVRFNSSTSSKGHFTIATTLYQLRFQTTLTTLTGLHLAHTFVLQSAWSTLHVSLREASLRILCLVQTGVSSQQEFLVLQVYIQYIERDQVMGVAYWDAYIIVGCTLQKWTLLCVAHMYQI